MGAKNQSSRPAAEILRWIPPYAGVILAFIFFCSACIPILFLYSRACGSVDGELRSALLDSAQSSALLVNGDWHQTFVSPEQAMEKEYLVQSGALRRFIMQNPRLTSLKTYVMKDGEVRVVIDTAETGASLIMAPHPDPSPELMRALRESHPVVEQSVRTGSGGASISGYAPVYDSLGHPVAVIGADLSADEITARKEVIERAAGFGLAMALLCSIGAGAGVWALRRRILAAAYETETARAAHEAAEFRYQHLFRQIPTGVIYYNTSLVVTDCNQRIHDISGSPREGIIGMNLAHTAGDRLLPCLHDALANRTSVYVGPFSIGAAARGTWVEIRTGPIKDGGGRIIGGIATVEDITIRHRAEMMSEIEKNLLGMIARGEPLNATLKRLAASVEQMIPDSMASIHLIDEDRKLLLKGIAPSLPPEYVEIVSDIPVRVGVGSCGEAAATGRPVIVSDIQTDPRWASYRDLADRFGFRACWSMPIISGKDQIRGTFALYYRRSYRPDQYERSLLENASYLADIAIEHDRFEKAISRERNLLKTLIDNIPDIIFVKDRLHAYLIANRAAVRTMKVETNAELQGKTDFDIMPEHEARLNHEAEAFVLEGNTQIDEESVIVGDDGTRRHLATTRLPLRDNTGQTIGLVTIVRDITEKHHVNQERIKNQKLESLGILAGGIAHDFNNILTSILGNLSFVNISEKNIGMEAAEMLKEAEAATQRAKDLTQQLLTFAKGGAPVKKRSSVADLIRDTATFAMRGSASKPEFDMPDDLWMAEVDAGQINQVVQNLLFNADQSMKGGGTITVRGRNTELPDDNVYELPPGRYISVSITDHGTGIPEEIQKRIFDPYFTTKKAGSGLGLTTTFSIIQKHNGIIRVDSETGRGSTFTFMLPALAESAPAEPTPPAPEPEPERAHILIMDDEEAILKICSRILEQSGFTVSLARHGEEAVERYRESAENGRPVHVTLLDLTIPGGMGGRETFEKLKSIDPDVRAIVSSGYSVDEVMAHHGEYGFVGVVTKPYSRQELLSAVREALA